MDFYWAIADAVAVGSLPYSSEDIKKIKSRGIRAVLSLHPVGWQARQALANEGIEHESAAITDFTAPSFEEMDTFTELLEKWRREDKPVLIHCFLGRGRSRTVAAAYLACRLGSVAEAIDRVGRPQTKAQMEFIEKYAAARCQKPAQPVP